MKIAVTDTNIFIDLIKTGLLPKLFQTDFTVHTTSEVVNELLDYQQTLLHHFIRDGKLLVSSFSPAEIIAIENMSLPPGLSAVDMGVFYYAQSQDGYFILSNDNLLRKTCQNHHTEVHGTLWLLDLFLDRNLCTKAALCQALSLLMKGFNRLPKNECNERILKWGEQ